MAKRRAPGVWFVLGFRMYLFLAQRWSGIPVFGKNPYKTIYKYVCAPDFLHTLMLPLPSLLRILTYVYIYLLLEMWDPSRPKYPKKYQNSKYLARKKQTRKARQGHIKRVYNISGSISEKRREHWTLKEIGVICLNNVYIRIYTGKQGGLCRGGLTPALAPRMPVVTQDVWYDTYVLYKRR